MKIKNAGMAAVLATAVLIMSGCDQAPKAAQQLLSDTAKSAKQAIDDTHKAAEQALNDVMGVSPTEKDEPAEDRKASSHTI